MGWLPNITCMWPGLARLWLRGSWVGLTLAITFGILLDAAIVLTWIWPGWGDGTVLWLLWAFIVVFWVFFAWAAYRHLSPWMDAADGQRNQDLLREAQGEYLRGDWIAAEALLRQLVDNYSEVTADRADVDVSTDVGARLMQVTLYRRTGRHREALGALERLERLERAASWGFEIRQERRRLITIERDPDSEDEISRVA